MTLAAHPAADCWPMMDATRFQELIEDIKKNGQRVPIVMCDSFILDGRNRYKACLELNITPRFEQFPADDNPFSFVESLNGHRRDITKIQRDISIMKSREGGNAWEDAKSKVTEAANAARSVASEGNKSASKTVPPPLVGTPFNLPPVAQPTNYPPPPPLIERTQIQRGIDIMKSREENFPPPPLFERPLAPPFVSAPPIVPRDRVEERARTTIAAITKEYDVSRKSLEVIRQMERNDEKHGTNYVDKVHTGELKATEAMRLIKKAQVHEVAPLTGKYRIIYADPPWKYNDKMEISNDGLGESYGPADSHYRQMTINELCALSVIDIAEDNAVLFFWVTSPLLENAFEIIKAWGFKYKTSFIWDKIKHNMGHYNSVRHEILLVCTRGSCTPDVSKLFDSVQSIERMEHSVKPQEFRNIIETLYTRGNKIELFARTKIKGWDAWGNQS